MTNFQKRFLTALVVLPISLIFVLIGGYATLLFLLTVFFIANYELFTVFKKKTTILKKIYDITKSSQYMKAAIIKYIKFPLNVPKKLDILPVSVIVVTSIQGILFYFYWSDLYNVIQRLFS